jgi:hypothetical protein
MKHPIKIQQNGDSVSFSNDKQGCDVPPGLEIGWIMKDRGDGRMVHVPVTPETTKRTFEVLDGSCNLYCVQRVTHTDENGEDVTDGILEPVIIEGKLVIIE